MVNKAGRE